jgi:hypothetical protein
VTALLLAMALAMPDGAEAYSKPPKNLRTYPEGMLQDLIEGCTNGDAPGNRVACICTAWTFAEKLTFDDVRKLGVDKAMEEFHADLRMYVKKHPLKK